MRDQGATAAQVGCALRSVEAQVWMIARIDGAFNPEVSGLFEKSREHAIRARCYLGTRHGPGRIDAVVDAGRRG